MMGGQLSSLAANMPAGLPPRARLVLLSLACLSDGDGITPKGMPLTSGRLAERCGMSAHTLRRALADLAAADLLEWYEWGCGRVYSIAPIWRPTRQTGQAHAPKGKTYPILNTNERNQDPGRPLSWHRAQAADRQAAAAAAGGAACRSA